MDVRRFRQQYQSQRNSIIEKKVCNNLDMGLKEAVFVMKDMVNQGLVT